MSSDIIVRVQSPSHGTKRIECRTSESLSAFLKKVKKEFNLEGHGWSVYKERNRTGLLNGSTRSSLNSQAIKHGDMMYLVDDDPSQSQSSIGSASIDSVTAPDKTEHKQPASETNKTAQSILTIDEVDEYLDKQDGLIHRERNEQLCHHGPSGKCLHCVPLEPYDEAYLRSTDPPIKFLSFNSYIRKLTGGVDRGKFVNLENLRCKIRGGCKEHPPWPGGICTKCQPSAVTLNRQVYRHIDHIIIENPAIADHFLNYWRNSGNQRIGILYGKYDLYPNVPLGIKATVMTIYEPPQKCKKNHIQLLDDPNESLVKKVASKLGIRPIGWIFTDLIADDLSKGTVKHSRGHMNSHFLSAEECIMAATFQNKYPNSCRLSRDGHFGSKFVTIVVAGDSSNQVHFDGYQVSNQCMALVRDECFIPTKDASELGYIKESSNAQYVPDVFYKDKDEYGNEVTHLGRPLPVEYLLVDMPTTFPLEPQFTLNPRAHKSFPVENRSEVGELQDFNALMQYMEQFPQDRFLDAMSDFHLLLFIASSDMLPLKAHVDMLLDAVKSQDISLAYQFKKTEAWATVEEMFAAHAPSPTTSGQESGSGAMSSVASVNSSHSTWTCARCTFINQNQYTSCEICSQSKNDVSN